jgi:hypothetical protein
MVGFGLTLIVVAEGGMADVSTQFKQFRRRCEGDTTEWSRAVLPPSPSVAPLRNRKRASKKGGDRQRGGVGSFRVGGADISAGDATSLTLRVGVRRASVYETSVVQRMR